MEHRRLLPVALGLLMLLSVGCGFLKRGRENSSGTPMTLSRMEAIVGKLGKNVRREGGRFGFTYEGIPMVLLSDTSHDRMRVVAPAAGIADMTEAQREAVMEANFHTALDARYAVSGDTLYACYIHPLSPLTDSEFLSGVDQVAQQVKTFGTTYNGGNLSFSGNGRREQP